ncbi:MAG: T9SS type A sorting domain-containing protein, partial [Bacteroidia bacterium]
GAYGMSGGAPGGDGGKGAGFTDSNCNNTDPSGNGLVFGGGGGGGNGNGGGPGFGGAGYCIITWGPAALQTVNAAPQISIAPNPFTDRIQVVHARGNELYEVFNAQGQMIWAGKDIATHDFSDLAQGFYVINIRNNAGVQTLKLLKQ